LNKIIVYGKNAVGKTNLGLAIFDIITHLTEKNVTPEVYDFYLNADLDANDKNTYAEFRYDFRFDSTDVKYIYRKSDERELIYEEVRIDDEIFFIHDFIKNETEKSEAYNYVPLLNLDYKEKTLSLLRYIVNNSKEEDVKPLYMLMQFVSRMLWFRSLDVNRYIGYKTDSSDYFKFIFEGNNLKEFEILLNKAGVDEKLTAIEDPTGKKSLYFKRKKPIPFQKAASNGTQALYTFFYWLKTCENISFLFIDEFDAYYHVELSETIVEMLEQKYDFQAILTSHNTNLLSNRIMRPDCYFILTSEHLVSFANATKRELREGHNLEKLYLSGEFDE
jgi:AAA15 family ATPase/GTPase